MGSKKRDLEIVYNLLWKNRPLKADDRSNIVGMYDVPSTTLDWDTFKSYLLKNSGTSNADFKVSYIDSDDKEIPIDSQTDFQLALYSFRKRARVGEIITLILENTAECRKKMNLCSFRMRPHQDEINFPPDKPKKDPENPPDWFVKYMKKFKKELVDEMTAMVNANMKAINSNQHSSHHSRKTKVESYKRSRKFNVPLPLDLTKSNLFEKEFYRQSKLESKLENKLEKLEHKTMKIKAKKLALKVSSDSDVGRSSSKSRLIGQSPCDSELLMNATAVNTHEPKIPHMLGGEIYVQHWEVMNSGKLAWTNDTELRFAWGSEALIPIDKKVSCPPLQPGEKGVVSVLLEIPALPGNYECYFHFHHFGRRFGHWLGCQIIVDEPIIKKTCSSPQKLNTSIPPFDEWLDKEEEQPRKKTCSSPQQNDSGSLSQSWKKLKVEDTAMPKQCENENQEKASDIVEPVVEKMRDIKIEHDNDLNSSDTDNISILSLSGGSNSGSSAHNFDYIVVPKQEEVPFEEIKVENVQENAKNEDVLQVDVSQKEGKENVNNDEWPLELPEGDEYAFVLYNGKKLPFHKRFLNKDYFDQAMKVPATSGEVTFEPISQYSQTEIDTTQAPSCETDPNQARTLSSNENRLFVFPQYSPGFEVYSPTVTKDMTQQNQYIGDCESFMSFNSDCLGPESQNVHACGSFKSHPHNRMYSSMNSVCNNAGSQHGCSNTHQAFQSLHCSETEGDFMDSFSSLPCPYKLNEHYMAGCNATTCNVNSSTPPRVASSASSPHALYENAPFAKTEMITSTTYSTPQMSETVQNRRQQGGRNENIISEAAIFASSAMSTARNVMNMVIQNGQGKWINGHWVADDLNSKRETGLKVLAEMGFLNRDLNATLLARFNDDVHRVISELVQ